MSVYKRGRLYWYEFVWQGERIRWPTGQTNKNVARQMEAVHRSNLAKGEVGIRDKRKLPTVEEFASQFLKTIETDCQDRPFTIRFYKSNLRRVLKFAPLASARLDRVDAELIESFKQHRTAAKSSRGGPYAVGTINGELATLRRLLLLAVEFNKIDKAPKVSKLGGANEREYVVSPAVEKLYLDAADDDHRDMTLLMVDTGLRAGEVLKLDCADVHLEPASGASLGYVHVRAGTSKNGKPRNLPLTERTVDALSERVTGRGGYVFTRDRKRPYSASMLTHRHDQLRLLLGLPADFVPHSLRHTFGTRLGEARASVYEIMRLMGHSTLSMSQKYVHPSPEVLERAVQAMENLSPAKKTKRRHKRPKRRKSPQNHPQ